MRKLVRKIRDNKDIHHNVFWPSAGIILLFIGLTLGFKDTLGGEDGVFSTLLNGISSRFGWFYILAVNIVLVFTLFIGFSKFSKIRIGGKNAKPEFSTPAWFAMLFSAGMGIGILFWSVSEPIMHYITKPLGASGSAEAAQEAMNVSIMHWGLHAWSIYALVGLALAYFTFNRNLPLTISSLLYPILGDRVKGIWGDIIDILAVIATLFGLSTSLGLGAQQIQSGLTYLYGIGEGSPTTVQVIVITIITGFATLSVILGVDKGVRKLSELNLALAVLFLIAIIIIGPTMYIADSSVQNIGGYIYHMTHNAFWTEAYETTNWQNSWTVFYWGWWFAWSPFVGMFIARVSKGRTIREFIFSVLLIPTIFTIIWFSAFGGSAISQEIAEPGVLSETINKDYSQGLFVFLEQLPWTSISSLIGVILITNFFVTSSDSGSLVIDSITSGGQLDAPVAQRIFWATTEGAVAITLLIGGGLSALQTASITTGLPLAILLLIVCYSLYKSLKNHKEEEYGKES